MLVILIMCYWSEDIGICVHNVLFNFSVRLYNNESFQLFIERWQKLEKVGYCQFLFVTILHAYMHVCRISSTMMANLTSARSQTFMTVSNMTCYTTGIVSSHCSSSCTVMIMLQLSCSHLGLKVAYDLYIQSMHLADLVMPQEYGITCEEKLEIASRICSPLLSKIQTDISNTLLDSTSDVINRLDPK